MAPFGKIFTKERNPRTTAILAVAKANGLDLETVEVDTKNPTPAFLEANPLSKVPAFVGTDGYVLTETMAIAIYLTSQNEKTTLLGKTKQDYASILKWMSLFNTEVLPILSNWYRPLLGWSPYNKKSVDEAIKGTEKVISVIEKHLLHSTYLVGERITLADLFATAIAARGFQFFFDKAWRSQHPNFSRWYETVYNQPIYSDAAPPFELLDKATLANVPPKKEEKPKQPKQEKPKQEKAAAPEEDAPKPKPKHPLEALPKPSFALDDWKRFYSNHELEESLKWFWENVPFNEYSIWKCEYRYNKELTLTFMSKNLIGGFEARLEASRKYLFGSASVFGENRNSVIQGAFVIRGDDFEPVFDVAPDYESYEFTKLDPTNPEDKAFVESMWSWDKPIVKDGETFEHYDGKVFK